MYLDGLGKFLVIFVHKHMFYPCLKKLGQKITFLAISQRYDFSQKSDYSNRLLVKFPFLEMYNFIYFISFKNNFSQKATILRGWQWHHP